MFPLPLVFEHVYLSATRNPDIYSKIAKLEKRRKGECTEDL